MQPNKIISWYNQHKRNLPWRTTRNPYFIWLSEIILQQTRVAQGLPYYQRFTEHYPTLQDLAHASEEEVLRLWQGLGYYSRGRNLHATAKHITQNLDGNFPNTYEQILKLKGVGEYTAAAIASFAFKEKVAAVDGNVIRVISRLYNIDEPVDQPTTLRKIKSLAQNLIQEVEPDLFNQAMMELGATVCTPKSPICSECPVLEHCLSYPKQDYLRIPFKAKKTKVLAEDIHYLVVIQNQKIFLKHRTSTGIWKNMYDFPELKIETLKAFQKKYTLNTLEPITHILSHRKLTIYFHICAELPQNIEGEWYTLEQTDKLPKPKVIVDFIKAETFDKS